MRRWDLSKEKPVIATRFIREKRWVPTTQSEALRMIEEEMPETDAVATLSYILAEIKKGKIIVLTKKKCLKI